MPRPLTLLLVAISALLAGCEARSGEAAAPAGDTTPVETAGIPAGTVVFTFDDALRSHLTVVAPLLLDAGFGATFFVTARWMGDHERSLDWEEVAKLHRMGFEIGNHSWSHCSFADVRAAELLPGELARVEEELARVGVPKPVSFAWPGNLFCPQSRKALAAAGYRLARRGMDPEYGRREDRPGLAYDPAHHHPLLIPSAAEAGPQWTLDGLMSAVAEAVPGRAVVLQFHGVPDLGNPRVSVTPAVFRSFVDHLREGGFHVVALRDLEPWVRPEASLLDPMAHVYHSSW